ncbi:MAG: hypothetical protein JXR97_09960, partial [Planctomycetes bacterium]|nr:hypothetical protein [Planctomycetota bacterium]
RIAFYVTIVAISVGFVAKCFNCYNNGAAEDGWSFNNSCVTPFDRASRDVALMEETGQLAESNQAHGLAKLALINPDSDVMLSLFLGIAGVVIFSLLRFRFSWWPIHPLIFCVWGTYPIGATAPAFLIGWIIKELIVKFAGGKAYQELKPLFLGLIVGELLATIIGVIINVTYFFNTGLLPKTVNILPG